MFATIVSDQFTSDELELIASSLSEICSPDDNYGWASNGLYSFWDTGTSEILYLGLSKDLPRRFREHAGLKECDVKGCKVSQIKDYFAANPGAALGYSVVLQSVMEQTGQSAFAIFHPEMGDTGTKDMKAGEGLLLQAHKLVRGDLPAWNKIGGDRDASDLAKHGHEPILRFLSEVDRDCPYRAELPLRSLAKNAVVVNEELELHLIRMFALNFTGDLKEALEIHRGMQRSNPDSDKTLNRSNCKRWIERWCR